MAFKCPNCAGKLHYSISQKKLRCDYCDSAFPINNFDVPEFKEGESPKISLPPQDVSLGKNEVAEEYVMDGMTVTSFVCKSCGAEIISPEESIVGYCSYCGSESALESRLDTEIKPKFIMPFVQTKEACKKVYQDRTKGMMFLPSDLKNPEYLERFRGTYIPYWMYRVDFPEPVNYEAMKKKRSGDLVTETTYDVVAKIDGEYEGVPYDASSCFDDTISDMLMPFDKKNLVEFHPGYLAGFYADRADVPPSKYFDDVLSRAGENGVDAMDKDVQKHYKMEANTSEKYSLHKDISATIEESYTALLPIWFLTWRNKNRVAYAIVNGQNGRLSCDLPVDMKKFYLSTLGTAAALFLLLTFLASMTARTALIICSIIAVIAIGFMEDESREIRDRENHIFDKGYFVKDRQVKMKEKKREKIRTRGKIEGKLWTIGRFVFLAVIAVIINMLYDSGDASPSDILLVVTFICLIIGTISAVKARSALRFVREKSIRIVNLVAWLPLAVSFAIAAWNPVEDYYYYLGCIACGVGAALTSIGLIKYYNLLSTRPIPTFFDREGGRDNAKE